MADTHACAPRLSPVLAKMRHRKAVATGAPARSRAITTSSKIHAWEAQLPAEYEALRGPGRGRSCEKASSWLHPQSCHC